MVHHLYNLLVIYSCKVPRNLHLSILILLAKKNYNKFFLGVGSPVLAIFGMGLQVLGKNKKQTPSQKNGKK